MIRLLLDQGLPRSAAQALRTLGLDVIHVGECGMAASTDRDILMRANRESRVVVTLDADFHALMALSNEAVPSVIRLRIEGLRGEALAALLQRVLQVIPDALDQGGVAVTVTEKSIRLRHLSQAAS